VASENPYSWFPTFRTPEEISTPSEKNRFVGFPYTKYLNAVIEVDMAASVVMTSVAKARELGIPGIQMGVPAWLRRRERHLVRERARELSFFACHPHDRRKAFAMAGKTVDDMNFIDLYSCFPSPWNSVARNWASPKTIRAG
jgi:acetyl-CoA C-acetyltransferase